MQVCSRILTIWNQPPKVSLGTDSEEDTYSDLSGLFRRSIRGERLNL